jgi:hypothetical protein
MKTRTRAILAAVLLAVAAGVAAGTFAAGWWGAPAMSADETAAWLERNSPAHLYDFECERLFIDPWDYECSYAVRGQVQRETRLVRVDGTSVIDETG